MQGVEQVQGIAEVQSTPGVDTESARAFLQDQRRETLEIFKYIFSEFLKWYSWFLGFNLAALGATVFVPRLPPGWRVFAGAFYVADAIAVCICVYITRAVTALFNNLHLRTGALMALFSRGFEPEPAQSVDVTANGVARWASLANALGLALFAAYWAYATLSR